MKFTLDWHANRWDHGEDDVHHGTMMEGNHFFLNVETEEKNYSFMVPVYQYDEEVVDILIAIVNKCN